jgi:acetate---CoA ligase (ADP-forming)
MSEFAEPTAAELVRLLDGSPVTIRPNDPADEPALRVFLARLCLEARRLRFFTGAADIVSAARLSVAENALHHGLIAHDAQGAVVGHAIYIQMDDTRAEVAVEVADHLHGRGLATILLARLAQLAESRGIPRFVAEVLPENHEMMNVFRHGFDAHARLHQGVEKVEFPTSAWRDAPARDSPALG